MKLISPRVIGCSHFLVLNLYSSLYSPDINPLSDVPLAKILVFFPFYGMPLHSDDCFLCCMGTF